MGAHDTSSSDFSSASLPQFRKHTLNGPAYVRLSKQPVHVDDKGIVRFERPLLETRKVTAESEGHGRYTVYTYNRIDFQDELNVYPESSSWTGSTDKYEQEIAHAKMVNLMAEWEKEGFVRDTLTPDTPANPIPPALPKPF